MNSNILRFLDFISEAREPQESIRPIRRITKFTQKDIDDISDYFLEYVDDYKMQELYTSEKISKSDVYFEIGLAANAYVEIHIVDNKNTTRLILEINRRMKNEFIPLMAKNGFKLFNNNINLDSSYINITEYFSEYCYNIGMVFYKED